MYLGFECVIFNYNMMGIVKVFLEIVVKYLVFELVVDKICVNGIFVGVIKILVVIGVKDYD